MSEPTNEPDVPRPDLVADPDGDPGNLSPRDVRSPGADYDDPDADPEMLNPREP